VTGKHCKVERCGRTARVEVWLDAYGGTDVLAGRIETQELMVCMEHAEMLGTVRGLESDYESPYVMVDRVRAAGWQIRSVVRAVGRWDVVLVAPRVSP
jgi:hypothetical protein